MLASLYGDLPPPSDGEGGKTKQVGGAPSASLLGSLYDDLDDPEDTESNTTTIPTSVVPAAAAPDCSELVPNESGNARDDASGENEWAAQRLKLLTPAVVRRQNMAKAAPSPSVNLPAAIADTAATLQRLRKVHADHAIDIQRNKDESTSAAASPDNTEPLAVSVVTVGGTVSDSPSVWIRIGSFFQEYDPCKPNDYSAIYRERLRQQKREELERLRLQEIEKQRKDREGTSQGSTMRSSGDATDGGAPLDAPQPSLPSYIDPSKKTFAARMMEKMGWKAGEGLGANKQGMTAPLVARKTAMRSGVIVQGAEVSVGGAAPRAMQFNRAPTRVVMLLNLVGRGEVDGDLQEETEEEAAKFGNLLNVKIYEAAGVPEDEAVRIFCEYERREEATRALMTLNGRVFGGRTVRARFYCEERFARDDLRPNTDEEHDQQVIVTV